MSEEHKRMDIMEFVEAGFLQEANRQFFHPLGLTLEVVVEKGITRIAGVRDARQDPEGFWFGEGDLDIEKARKIERLLQEKRRTREQLLGYHIQPVPWPSGIRHEE